MPQFRFYISVETQITPKSLVHAQELIFIPDRRLIIFENCFYRGKGKNRALKSREERMVIPSMGAAMIGPMYSLRENRAQHGGGGFHLRLSTL